MIKLRESEEEELKIFVEMEEQPHAKKFINGTDLETHKNNFKDHNIIYLSIENKNGELVGYFILAVEPSNGDVEFRRILIDENQLGIGQIAIAKMENYCREELSCKRIWLDVYEENIKGKCIYEKLGYKRFKKGVSNDRKLFYYQKAL